MRRVTLLAAVFFVTFGTVDLARPTPAYACLWNLLDYFLPYPPCPVKDEPVIHRVRQANARIYAKLLAVGTKITQVRLEIRQWQYTYQNARSFEETLRRTYGELTANPLPSLVAAYNRSGAGSWLRVNYEGGLDFSATLVDPVAEAERIRDAFLHEVDLRRIYDQSIAPQIDRLEQETFFTGRFIERQLQDLGDYRRATEQVRDSILAAGRRTAGRYEGMATAAGDAEARITTVGSTLARLRGTAFEAQAHSISQRLRALELAGETRSTLRRNEAVQASVMLY